MSKRYTPVATFPSSSNPNKTYTVSEDGQGNLSCSCPAWVFKKGATRTCKHVEEVARRGVGSTMRGQNVPDGMNAPPPAPIGVQAPAREKGGTLAEIFKKLGKE